MWQNTNILSHLAHLLFSAWYVFDTFQDFQKQIFYLGLYFKTLKFTLFLLPIHLFLTLAFALEI